jgi:hypothetical protein
VVNTGSVTLERAPVLRTSWLADPEKHNAWLLTTLLLAIQKYHRTFRAALRLFDQSSAQADEFNRQRRGQSQTGVMPWYVTQDAEAISDIKEWRFVAARDGAITLFNLRDALDAITAALHQCPTIKGYTKSDEFRKLKSIYDTQYFPKIKLARHAIAHSGEASGVTNRHSVKSPIPDVGVEGSSDSKFFLGEGLFGREFRATFSGHVVGYELSTTSLDHIARTINGIYSQFHEAERETRAQSEQAFRPRKSQPPSGSSGSPQGE